MSFTEIPTIDFALAEDPATLPGLLQNLRHALVDVGFLYVKNHAVPQDTIDNLVTILPRLFALPQQAKEAIALENSPHFLGYSGAGNETTGGKVDQREQIEFATELTETWSETSPLYERLRGPNQWPEELPELRQIVTDYIEELAELSENFLKLVAQALSLPPETFLSFLSDQHRLKLVRYPPLAPPPLEDGVAATTAAANDQGVGPHKDSSGWWTFLLQASGPEVEGLQALNKAGRWVDVPARPGTFVVNIGQAFEAVTGGACRATTHRVLLLADDPPRERLSVPFFQGVRRDLTRDAARALHAHFAALGRGAESDEGRGVDSAFLAGRYDTWGESQLRTKVRSHRTNGRKFYPEVFEQYISDDV